MDAVFRLHANEFDENFFSQVKSLLEANRNLEITIAINDTKPKGILRKETREEYFARLDKAIQNVNEGRSVNFSSEEFDDFSKQLLNEP